MSIMNYVQKTINKVISLNYMLNGMNYYIIYAFFCFGVTKISKEVQFISLLFLGLRSP